MSDINSTSTNKTGKPSYLTLDEIHRLINSPVDTKIDIAKNIAKYYQHDEYDDGQIRIAEQVFRTLLKDAEVKVRKSLSESIKNIDDIPYDVVVALARDIEEVSLPMLEFSEVLSDVDLIDIISSTESERQHIAITKRKHVNEKVSDALIETKNESVVGNLMQNKNAAVSETGLQKVIEHHADSEVVLGSMVERGSLPVNIVERLTSSVSNELYKKLATKHKSSLEKLEDAVKKGRDVAAMQVMGLKSSEEEYREFLTLMGKLKISEELIPISALCMANLNLFEISLARKTKVPVLNIRELIKDSSNQGFRAVYSRAGLPMHLFDACAMLLDLLRDSKENFASAGSQRLSSKAAHRLIEQYMFRAEEFGKPDSMEYILSIIQHNAEHK